MPAKTSQILIKKIKKTKSKPAPARKPIKKIPKKTANRNMYNPKKSARPDFWHLKQLDEAKFNELQKSLKQLDPYFFQ